MAVVEVADLRAYLRDTQDDNVPLHEEYLLDAELSTCIDNAIDGFNETPPMFVYPYTSLDFPHKRLLLEGSAIEAMRLTSMKELRREMQYEDGGIQSSLYYKSPQFRQILADMTGMYEQKKSRIKRQMNISNCYRGLR